MKRWKKIALGVVGGLVVLIVVAVVTTPAAPAPAPAAASGPALSATDAVYLAALRKQGIPFASDADAISAGHEVCTGLDGGATLTTIGQGIVNTGTYPPEQAGFVVGDAAAAYCPKYNPN